MAFKLTLAFINHEKLQKNYIHINEKINYRSFFYPEFHNSQVQANVINLSRKREGEKKRQRDNGKLGKEKERDGQTDMITFTVALQLKT